MGRSLFAPDVITSQHPHIDAMAYGTSRNDATIQAAITSAGGNNAVILISSGSWDISDNLTIPNNIILHIYKGGLLNISSGKILTINGTIDAGLYQIFNCLGVTNVIFGDVSDVYPEWWGAGLTTSDVNAIQQAADSLTSGGVINLSGQYAFPAGTTTVNLQSNIWIKGKERGSTIITKTHEAGDSTSSWIFTAASKNNIKITDLSVYGGGLLVAYLSSNILVDNVYVNGYLPLNGQLSHQLIYFLGTDRTRISNSTFIDGAEGVLYNIYGTTYATNQVIDNCLYEMEHFEHQIVNPVGVYLAFSRHTVIRGVTFRNISPYTSCVDPIRFGYGFYAGDGYVYDTVIDKCLFELTNLALTQPMMHILFWDTSNDWRLTNSTFTGPLYIAGGGTDIIVKGNIISEGRLLISSGNKVTISDNLITDCYSSAIFLGQGTTAIINHALVSNNQIYTTVDYGIVFNQVLFSIANGNVITDTNTSGGASRGSIHFAAGQLAVAVNNSILNTGLGKATWGIYFGNISKRCYYNNVISEDVIAIYNGYDDSPTRGKWNMGDHVWFTNPSGVAADPIGAVCVQRYNTTLSVGEPSAETTIVVSAVVGALNGDVIGILQDTGTILWTTIVSGEGTATFVIANPLTDDAAAGNSVYIIRWKLMADWQ